MFDPHRPFEPPLLPPKIGAHDEYLVDALIDARVALAELQGYSASLPNPFLLLSPAVLKEAIASSEIENIHTTLLGVLQSQLFPERERGAPDKEVLRYNEALSWGYAQMEKLPMYSSRLVLGVKNRLMCHPNDGYRKQQNAIATGRGEIIYIPPVAPSVPSLIQNIAEFVHDESLKLDPLIKAAIAHYQFEATHPFEDGNGRTGRILIVLHLVSEHILTYPILFMSGYINAHRSDYYTLLRGVTREKAWNDFILFFLKGFYEQATKTKKNLFEIMELFGHMKKTVKENHKKIYSSDLVEALFKYPIVTPVKLAKELKIHYTTASKHLSILAQGGMLTPTQYGKYHLFANKKLLQLLEK